jgi:cytochrome c-type biogenesis protein CcmH
MMKSKFGIFFRFGLILSLLLLGLLVEISSPQRLVPSAFAQDISAISDNEVNAIARQMFCPVCENTPLDVCPTQACAQWRELIRQKLAAGWSEQEIKDYFVEQYGARVLGAPPAEGFNWLVYLVPPIAILAGVYILLRALRSWKQPAAAPLTSPQAPAVEDEYTRRLEEELRKR